MTSGSQEVKKIKTKQPVGRPSKFTKELGNIICDRLSKGESLRQICRDEKIPDLSTVVRWIGDERYKPFRSQYDKAREAQAEFIFDEILDICDDGSNDWMEIETKSGRIIEVPDHEHINRSKLRVDTRKWFLSKVLPKIYGDKAHVEHSGAVGVFNLTEALGIVQQSSRLADVTPSKN